jgi:hypothetical protein
VLERLSVLVFILCLFSTGLNIADAKEHATAFTSTSGENDSVFICSVDNGFPDVDFASLNIIPPLNPPPGYQYDSTQRTFIAVVFSHHNIRAPPSIA